MVSDYSPDRKYIRQLGEYSPVKGLVQTEVRHFQAVRIYREGFHSPTYWFIQWRSSPHLVTTTWETHLHSLALVDA